MNIIDISQPIEKRTACFPGDTPFDFSIKASYAQNDSFNLTTFTMSPHVGTHADAPSHVSGELSSKTGAGTLPLAPFIGPCLVVDLSSHDKEISLEIFKKALNKRKILPRVLLKTSPNPRFDVFEKRYAYLSLNLVTFLDEHHVKLIGIDTPSVDSIDSKTLEIHHTLITKGIYWLENLDLSHAKEEEYFLSALPLKLMHLEAAPVRAILLPPLAGAELC